MAAVIDSKLISQVNKKESELTQQPQPVAKGPTAAIQRHRGEHLNQTILSEVAAGEKKLGYDRPVSDGPWNLVQSVMAQHDNNVTPANPADRNALATEIKRLKSALQELKLNIDHISAYCSKLEQDFDDEPAHFKSMKDASSDGTTDKNSPTVDASLVSKILEVEKTITHESVPVKGGPTAQAQRHLGTVIDKYTLHDITEGEKQITGQPVPVKGGPTAILQSSLSKARTSGDGEPSDNS